MHLIPFMRLLDKKNILLGVCMCVVFSVLSVCVCVKTQNWFSLQLWKDDLNSYKNDQKQRDKGWGQGGRSRKGKE